MKITCLTKIFVTFVDEFLILLRKIQSKLFDNIFPMYLNLLAFIAVNYVFCYSQGAFGKGALIGFGLTTYTLLGLGVVISTLTAF